MVKRTTIRRVTVLLAAAAAAAGCAGHPAPQSPAPGAFALGPAELALTKNAESERESWYLSRAEHILDQQCLAAKGFRYLVEDPGPAPGTNTVTGDALGTGGPATYAVQLSTATSTSASPEDQYVAGLPEATRRRYLEALNGPDKQVASLRLSSGSVFGYQTGGCTAQVRQKLYGSVAAMLESQMLPQDVTHELSAVLGSDQAYRSVAQAWQQCMRAAGHDFPSPQAAIHSIEQLADQTTSAAQLNEQQTALATADTACDGRTGLRHALAQARSAFVRGLPANIVTELADGYTIRQRAYRIAVTVP